MHSARIIAAPLAAAMFILAACSGGDGSGIAEPSAEGGPTTPPGTSSGDPQPDGGSSSGDGSVVTPDSAQPDAAADNRIDPITVGRSWTYDVTIIGTYPICSKGSHTGSVIGTKTVGGKAAFQVQSFCPGAGVNAYFVDGDKVEVYYMNTWVLALDAPVAEGHTWSDGVNSYVWNKLGKVTVPAGTYEDCWSAKHVGGASYTQYCRGVGPVKWHYVDAFGNGYDAILTSTKQ